MKHRFGAVVAFWGLLLTAIIATGLIAFGPLAWQTPTLLGTAAAVALLSGVLLALLRADASAELELRPELSPPTAWVGISLALLALSPALGFWLTLIAAGMLGVGIGGVARELRSERQALGALAARQEGQR